MLGSGVGGGVAEPHLAQDGGHIDDAAALARAAHRLDLRPLAQEHAVEIYVDDVLPALHRIVAAGRRRPADTRVVHRDIQPAQFLDGLLHGRFNRVLVGDVQGDADRLHAFLPQRLGGLRPLPLRSHTATAAPESASSSATARPMPETPPVTMATFPLS